MQFARFAAPLILLAATAQAQEASQSLPPVDLNAPAAPLPPSRDVAYPGVMTLRVNATDTATRAFRTVQAIPVEPGAREIILVYPKWLPGNHGPTGQIHRLGDLTFTAGGVPLQWRRDPGEPYAFRVALPEGTTKITGADQDITAAQGGPKTKVGKISGSGTTDATISAGSLSPSSKQHLETSFEATVTAPDKDGKEQTISLKFELKQGNAVTSKTASAQK